MRLQSLTHLLEATVVFSRERKIIILGSTSLYASCPELNEAGGPLESTVDADFLLIPFEETDAELLRTRLVTAAFFTDALATILMC